MTGLAFSVMLMLVGGAIDLSRWISARAEMRAAVDVGVLAGARTLQIGKDAEAAIAAATRYYLNNSRKRLGVEDFITFVAADDKTSMNAVGNSYIRTPFLRFAGIDRLPLIKSGDHAFAEAVISSGRHSQSDIEVALVLDITRSMEGQKLQDLKDAAKDLVEIVVWDEQGAHTSRLALVPFSEAVRIDDGTLALQAISDGPQRIAFYDSAGRRMQWLRDAWCATERLGLEAFTDAPPQGSDLLGTFYSSDGVCMPRSVSVVPLSAEKPVLFAAIDAFEASGTTAGHLGTAWAWYLLSPRWAQWLSQSGTPADYALTRQLGPGGQPLLRKIAILMTDGDYDTQYCKGVNDEIIACDAPNGSSADQARQLCANMKAAGITVYTVGFQLSATGNARSTLEHCASDPAKYFQAESGDALKQAFRDIAVQISPLYLTK